VAGFAGPELRSIVEDLPFLILRNQIFLVISMAEDKALSTCSTLSSSGVEYMSLQFLLPSKSVSDDGGEIIILWSPANDHAGAIAGGR
jgi:hypothetical protein